MKDPPGDGLNSAEDSDDGNCSDQNPDHFSSKQLEAPADFVINCRNRIVNSALENDSFSPECNESTVTSITDHLSFSSSNEDNSLSSSETSELKSKTKSEKVLVSETEKTVASRENEIDISLATPLSLSTPPLINRKWQTGVMVLPKGLPKAHNIPHNIYKCLGPKKMFQYGCLMLMMLTPTVPLLAKLINTAWFLPVLYIDMALNQFAVDITFISIHLLLGNSVEQALSGSVTGLGTAVSMVGRIAAPFGVGSLYTWSLHNKYGSSNPIGFPFNEYFMFFALSLVCLLSAGFTGLLPNTLNYRVREENQPLLYEESSTNLNSIYVSINTFILDSER